MDLNLLRDYNEWLKRSPGEVLKAVIKEGGWETVFSPAAFPKGLPIWAHRVRNYFNREPLYLTLCDERNSRFMLITRISWVRKSGFTDQMALSGDVYLDEFDKAWFQMSPGATIYHFSEPVWAPGEAAHQTLKGQSGTPIFKLVSSDGSGGSCETIIDNPLRIGQVLGFLTAVRGSTIGDVGERANVSRLIVKKYRYQGSYNYAETVEKGIDLHTKFDIDPHGNKSYGGYLNPSDRFSQLLSRKFPKDDGAKPVAEQV